MIEKESEIKKSSCLQAIFERTLQGYAQGFHVDHIATYGLETCSLAEDVKDVFLRLPDFDYIPVKKDDGRIIGVLERENNSNDGFMKDKIHALDDSIIISAEEPLSNFLQFFKNPPNYRLVIRGSQINGIVTRSDLLKLPVRLYAFALITNLEILMKEIICKEFAGKEDWLIYLSEDRRKNVLKKKADYAKSRMDPVLIELTDLCDKRVIVKKCKNLTSNFENELKKIEKLRNTLFHGGTFVESYESLIKFIDTINYAFLWTEKLSDFL